MRHLWWGGQSPERQSALREGVKQFRDPEGMTGLASAGRIGLAVFGLLCHLLLFLLLFFPYVRIFSPYVDGVSFTFTGWNLGHEILLGGNLISDVPPTLVLLPMLSYLACLLLLFLKRGRMEVWLEKSVYLNVLWNMLGFLVIYGLLFLSQMVDPLHWRAVRDASYALHLALFLLFAVCSSVSSLFLGWLLRRSRTNHR